MAGVTQGGTAKDDGSEEHTGETVGDADIDGASRLSRARDIVGLDSDANRQSAVRDADGSAELGLRVPDFATVYPVPVPNGTASKHARNLSKLLERDLTPKRANRVASTAREHAAADVPPSSYVGSYMPAFERLVEDAFETVEAGGDPQDAKADLLASFRTAMVDMQVGVDEFADTDSVVALEDDEYSETATMEEVLDSIPYPTFLIDDEHTLLEYNVGINRLLGFDDDHREFLGGDNRETIAAATYSDGSRHNSLVDKVAENPRDAEDHWGIENVTDEYSEYTDKLVYEDTSVTKADDGSETHIGFLAVPLFDDDGDLKAIFELVEDRSEEVLHQREVGELVTEVTDTLHQIGDGNLAARADYADDHGVIEPELLELTTDVNEMAESFEQLVEQVDEKADELTRSIKRATSSAHEINEQVDEQNDSLESVANEMEDFSATMEEVAASSNEVASAAERALEEAGSGVEAGEDARDVTGEVMQISDRLVETVEELDDYMDEIGEVAEVISDVADQTNMLALNANIEAARAGEAGSGFAVVADEVKQLATETQEHTEEIASRIETIQGQATETVDEVERSHDRIQDAEEEIGTALDSLWTISDKVEEAADGIHEVADANDEQAATVEEVMATIDDVRESAHDVSSTTEEIVHEAEKQESAVFELSDRVQELSTTSAGSEPDVDHDHI
ncbi:MAG: methyl-accepting chemotaxis protein [Haloarculaceae archaeon]